VRLHIDLHPPTEQPVEHATRKAGRQRPQSSLITKIAQYRDRSIPLVIVQVLHSTHDHDEFLRRCRSRFFGLVVIVDLEHPGIKQGQPLCRVRGAICAANLAPRAGIARGTHEGRRRIIIDGGVQDLKACEEQQGCEGSHVISLPLASLAADCTFKV